MQRWWRIGLALALATACGTSGQSVDRGKVLGADALMDRVRILASPDFEGRQVGSLGGQRAARYLVSAFEAVGLNRVPGLGYRQRLRVGTNVVGVIPGVGPRADEVVVIGAHYDHLGVKEDQLYPGANDNASGVSALLAAAELLVADPPEQHRTLLFVAFDAEEGGLFGSRAFLESPPVAQDRIVAAIILDMLGAPAHPGFGRRVVLLGTEKSPVLDRIAETIAVDGLQVEPMGLHLMESTPFRRTVWSDYGPFRDQGVPFAFLTTGPSTTYHRPSDTPESLDPALLTRAADWVERYVRALATEPVVPRFEAERERLERDLRQVQRLLELTLDPQTDFRNPLVRPAKLRAHLEAVDAVRRRVQAGEAMTEADVAALRAAALRVGCYAAGPGSPFSSLCNAF